MAIGFDAWIAAVESFVESPDLIGVLHRDGTVARASRGLGGVGPAEMVGRPFAGLVGRAHADAVRDAIAGVVASGTPRRLDIATTSAGTHVWSQLSLAPLREDGAVVGLVIVAAVITERKELEERLRRAEALMVDSQGTAHLGTWEWDVSQPHATWSAELYRIYGLDPATYTPSYEAYLTKVHPEDRPHVEAATRRVFEGHLPYSHDERIFRPDGSIRYLHTWAHAIVEDGKLVRLIGVCQDITDRKQIELELEERARELAATNERLLREMEERARVEKHLRQAHKLEALGRLAGGIAHDINNVMGAVIGYAGVIAAKAPEGSPLGGYAQEIRHAGERVAALTRRLLAFGREQVVQRTRLDLRTVVFEMTRMLRQLIGEDIEIASKAAPAPCGVEADASQLEQVVANLVLNARDAMPQGGTLTISVEPAALGEADPRVPSLRAGEYVCLTIADTGVGMTEEVQSRIFDPFFTTKEEGRGTGLGLSTVYGIVAQAGGAIHVQSAPGAGSRFDVFLPRVELDTTAEPKEIRRPPRSHVTATILLVEDQFALRDALRETLVALGYVVIDAAGGAEALQVVAAHSGPIDLLLTDIVMPKMGGPELAERLRAERPGLRVLYMSGYADASVRDLLADRSAAILAKPFSAEALEDQLRAMLHAPAP